MPVDVSVIVYVLSVFCFVSIETTDSRPTDSSHVFSELPEFPSPSCRLKLTGSPAWTTVGISPMMAHSDGSMASTSNGAPTITEPLCMTLTVYFPMSFRSRHTEHAPTTPSLVTISPITFFSLGSVANAERSVGFTSAPAFTVKEKGCFASTAESFGRSCTKAFRAGSVTSISKGEPVTGVPPKQTSTL